jgi:putative transcriptional regulator
MRRPSTKYKVGQLRARLNEFEKPRPVDQKGFADLIGTTKHTVVSLEVGRLKLSRELAWRIARETGVYLDWLLDDDLKSPIVNYEGRPYTQKDFTQARKRSGQKELARTLTHDYASKFDAQIRAILASASKKDSLELATRKIERFLGQCLREFDPNFELREQRRSEQARLTPAQRKERIGKRDAAARVYALTKCFR